MPLVSYYFIIFHHIGEKLTSMFDYVILLVKSLFNTIEC